MRVWRAVAGALVVVAAVLALRLLPIGPWLAAFQQYVREAGPLGYVVYAIGYGLVALFFPASVLTIGAGAIFGAVAGTAVVAVGATIAAGLAFLLARTVLRNRIERRFADDRRFRAVDTAIAREGVKIVFLVRLAAVFPFTLVNYLFGLTAIRFLPYLGASLIGILPGTIAFVSIGATGAAVASQDRTRLIFTIAGVVIALAVSIFVGRLASAAIRRAGVAEGTGIED